MRAKKIIKLCEDEQLDSNQIFNLIHDYFVKKMKSAGMTLTGDGPNITATLKVLLSVNTKKVNQISRAYVKNMALKFDGDLDINSRGGVFRIFYPNPVSSNLKANPLFYVYVRSYVSKSSSPVIELIIVFSGLIKSFMLRYFNFDPEFITEEGRKEIFELIDSLAKFIRLTPLGK